MSFKIKDLQFRPFSAERTKFLKQFEPQSKRRAQRKAKNETAMPMIKYLDNAEDAILFSVQRSALCSLWFKIFNANYHDCPVSSERAKIEAILN